MKANERIIVALDVPTASEADILLEQLGGEVGAFKIGLQLFTAEGPRFVKNIVERGYKVFLDVKYHDIPATVAKAAVEAARLGVWMFNIHTLGGSEMIKRTVKVLDEVCLSENLLRPKLIGVTVLTSSDQEMLRAIGVSKGLEEQVIALAKIAYENGLDGVVASSREASIIRAEIEDHDFLIVTPGIRNANDQGISNDDQKRVLTPSEAIQAGADYLVVGRPILNATDPSAAVQYIAEQITNTCE